VYFEESLSRMLERTREGDLAGISELMREEPCIQDPQELTAVLQRKSSYLLNEMGDCGRNALHWAIHSRNAEVVSFLLIKGADPCAVTIDHYTPLQLAVLQHASNILEMLLQQPRADPNQTTQHGSALHLAVRNEDFRCLELLLQHEAEVDVVDGEGKTPLDICQNKQMCEVLKRKGEVGKLVVPNIAKGSLFRVGAKTKRLKERCLLLNPFKDELTISDTDGTLEQRIALSEMRVAEKAEPKGWLMKSSVSYFRVEAGDPPQEILFAANHSSICKRWVYHLQTALSYRQFAQYTRPVPPNDQVVEFLDDAKGITVLHKRKVEEKPAPKVTSTIMDLRRPDSLDEPSPIKKTYLKKTEETESNRSNEEDKFK
jgi:hypothetical protein